MPNTDALLSSYLKEIEERQAFIDGLIAEPKGENGDLSEEQLEMVTRSRDRIKKISDEFMGPLEDIANLSAQNIDRWRGIAERTANIREKPQAVEYRNAGEYAMDMWEAGLGNDDAKARLHRYAVENRVAAHTTTSTATGLVPTPILAPVIDFVDGARPVVSALGPRQLPSWSFSRPKVTTHTAVAAQSSEKAELTSQAMAVTKLAVSPATYGGYANVSRQLIDFGTVGGSAMDLIIGDLATQYAIATEAVAVQALYAGGTASAVSIPGTPTADNVAAAFWSAAGGVYNAVKGQGRLIAACSPDVLGSLGGLFAPVNPLDSQSPGFTAGTFGSGLMGTIGGIPVYVTAGFATTKRLMIMSTAAGEVYEDRIGPLSVVEPSVLGVQVAYAGHFATLVVEAGGIQKVTVA